MTRFLFAAAAGILLASTDGGSISAPTQAQRDVAARRVRDCDVPNRTCDVSILRLITTPDLFHGKVVRVAGVASVAFESNSISPTKETIGAKSMLWVDFHHDIHAKLDGKPVVLEGTFDALSFGHLGAYAGSIHSVTRADPL